MKRNSKIIKFVCKFLYAFAGVSVIGYLLSITASVVVALNLSDLKFGSWEINPFNKGGYTIPVNATLHLPTSNHAKLKLDTTIGKPNKYVDVYKFDTSNYKRDSIKKWIATPIFEEKEYGWEIIENDSMVTIAKSAIDVIEVPLFVKTYVKAKGKSFKDNVILAMDGSVKLLSSLIISYLIFQVLWLLYVSFDFNRKVIAKVKWIALCLIVEQLVLFWVGRLYLKIYGNIHLYDGQTKSGHNPSAVTFNPTYDINFNMLYWGIILFVFSLLYKKGVELKEENDLTV